MPTQGDGSDVEHLSDPPPTTSRVLLVHRGAGPEAQPGVIAGWQELRQAGQIDSFEHLAVDTSRPVDTKQTWEDILERVLRNDIDTLVLHHFHAQALGDPRPGLERVRSRRPGIFVMSSNGDGFMNGYWRKPALPEMFLQACELSDLVISTSMGTLADRIARRSPGPVVLIPNGVFAPQFERSAPHHVAPEFDVVFIGSNNRSRNVFKPYHWLARRREWLLRDLAKRFGNRLGVFGHGWEGLPGWQGPLPFDQQWAATRRGKVVVGGIPFSTNRYYLSNRPFIQIASGVPFVDLRVDGVDCILRDGDHWHLVDDERDFTDRCEQLLTVSDDERAAFGNLAAEYVLTNHTDQARVRSVLRTIGTLRTRGPSALGSGLPDFAAFLPEVDERVELALATRNWG